MTDRERGPWLGRLITRLLPKGERESIVGDLEESHVRLTRERGVGAADRRYLRDSIASVWWRRMRRLDPLDALAAVRIAVRTLMREPGFAAAAILTLALGIGLATAVFTITNALLLRRLPVADQDRLIALAGDKPDAGFSKIPLTLSQVRDLERESQTLDAIAFVPFRGAVPAPARAGDRTFPIQLGLVSGNFFDVLQSRAVIGRTLRPDDDVEGAAPVVVLSHRGWQQGFGGDSSVVGRSITMIYTGQSYTIVGVMPPGLEYPRDTEVWAPLVAYAAAGGFLEIVSQELDLVARLRPSATPSQVAAELTGYFRGPNVNDWQRQARGVAQPLEDVILGDTRSAVILVAIAAALLLLLTVLNVANLLLVRALGRVKELVVRSSLGASRWRIGTQLLTESGLLALLGGVAGVAVATASVRLFLALVPAGFPRIEEVRVDGASLVAALVVTTLATLVAGLAPFLFATRVRARDVLRTGAHHTGDRRTRAVGEALVVGQIGLAAATLCAAGLVTRSLIELQTLDLAFDRSNILVATLAMPAGDLSDPERQRTVLGGVVEDIGSLRGVTDVTPVFAVPFIGAGGGIDARVSIPELSASDPDGSPVVNMEIVASNYFAMLGMPVLRGRPFTDADREGSVPVAVVSSSLARRLWPDRDPIGQLLRMGRRDATVVGEVPDTRYRDFRTARPTLYLPLGQGPVIPSTLLVRTVDAPSEIVPTLRRVVAAAHPDLALVNATSLETMIEAPLAQPRLNTSVLGLFATTALLLAGVGLFSTIATMVRQRTREIGVRMALGASPRDVHARVMLRGAFLATAGGALGIGGALAASRLFSAILFEISPTDLPTMLVVAGLLLGVALCATFVPAVAGMRIDPAVALRSEF